MKLGFVLLIFFLVSEVQAASAPRTFTMGSSSFSARTLSNACFGMDAEVDGLPCNPAMTAKERDPHFQVDFFFGNNVSYIRDVSQLMNGHGDEETVNHLFSQRSSGEMEANIQATYLHENWGLSYAPYRLFYYSVIRNSSLPVISLYAGQEQTLTGQLASYEKENFYWGLQLRAVDRKFISSEFTLTDALASGNSQYFDTKNQRAVYIEPGFLFHFAETPWEPQAGLTIKNAGIVDHKYDEVPASPDWHLAGSVKPPVGLGVFELGLDLVFNSEITEAREIPKLGASYSLGAMQALASYGDREYSVGFMLRYHDWTGGLSYWRKKFENLIGEQDQMQTVYLELSFII